MKIELEVSADNEGTASPYWLILDPAQNMSCDVYVLASQITGPFFSRREAEHVLKVSRHHFSRKAVVYCHSGYMSGQYHRVYENQWCKEIRTGRQVAT